MSSIFRPAQPQEWQIIQELNSQVFQSDKDNDPDMDLYWPYTEIGINYYKKLADGSYGHCIVAEVDGVVVGYVALAKKEFDYRKSKYVEIENIGVDPQHRSTGIGKQLMDAAAQWAKEQGADRLHVEAFWGNQRGISFYKQNDFFEIGVQLERIL